jgi:hypothetical protein
MLSNYIYIYRISGDHIVYDRLMPRAYVAEVDKRLKELRSRGLEAFYTIGETIKEAYY